jgi:hypothetical protein
MRPVRILIVFSLILCVVPALSLAAAAYIARSAGCELDPDLPLPCAVLGGQFGDVLFAVSRFGWNTVFTLPVFAALLVAWLLIELVRLPGRRDPAAQAPAISRNRARGS